MDTAWTEGKTQQETKACLKISSTGDSIVMHAHVSSTGNSVKNARERYVVIKRTRAPLLAAQPLTKRGCRFFRQLLLSIVYPFVKR